MTHHCHHRPVSPFRDWYPFTKLVLILTEKIISTLVLGGFDVFDPFSWSVLKSQILPPGGLFFGRGGAVLKSSVTGPSPTGREEGRRKEEGEKKEEEEEKRECTSNHHSGNSVW